MNTEQTSKNIFMNILNIIKHYLLLKINGCKNNPDKSSRTKVI